jgi:hypothetical protein
VVPSNSQFFYTAGPDLFGHTALTFDLTLVPSTGAPNVTVPYTIHIIAVNDPPVIVPSLYTFASGIKNECDEDTFIFINFKVTDIDDPPQALKTNLLDLVFIGAPGKFFYCVAGDSNCDQNPLVPGPFDALDNQANFRFLFIPDPNVNGVNRLQIQAIDGSQATSAIEIVEITVLPINDAPDFEMANWTLTKDDETSQDKVNIVSLVGDIDFTIGFSVNVTYTLISTTKAGAPASSEVSADGHFLLPKYADEVPPCIVSENGKSITCIELIENTNPWLIYGIDLVFDLGVTTARIELNVNDFGNIDKNFGRDLNSSFFVDIDLPLGLLVGDTATSSSNLGLILGPLFALIGAGLIAGLAYAFRRRIKEAIDSLSDDTNGGSEAPVNISPLYEEAAIGGESPIYRAST